MNSKYINNQTLVSIKLEPLNYDPPLIKSEYVDYQNDTKSSSILPNTKVKNEFEVNSSWPINTRIAVKQELSDIKIGYNDYQSYQSSLQNTAMKPKIPVKMEQKHIPSIKPWNMPLPKCKSEPREIKTFYKCCNIKFDNKYQHFHHMLGHMEEEMTCAKTKCYHCNRYFKTKNDMMRHAKSKHIGFKCTRMSCLQTFKRKRDLIQHLEIVHKYKAQNKNIDYNNLSKWHRNIWDNKSKILQNDILKIEEEMKLKKSPDVKIKQSIEPIFSKVKETPIVSNIKSENKVKIEENNFF